MLAVSGVTCTPSRARVPALEIRTSRSARRDASKTSVSGERQILPVHTAMMLSIPAPNCECRSERLSRSAIKLAPCTTSLAMPRSRRSPRRSPDGVDGTSVGPLAGATSPPPDGLATRGSRRQPMGYLGAGFCRVGGGIGVLAAVLVARVTAPWAPTVSLLALWGVCSVRSCGRSYGLVPQESSLLDRRTSSGAWGWAGSATCPGPVERRELGAVSCVSVLLRIALGWKRRRYFRRRIRRSRHRRVLLPRRLAGRFVSIVPSEPRSCRGGGDRDPRVGGSIHLPPRGVRCAEPLGWTAAVPRGGACSGLVIMTGRIWGAVLANIVYNFSFVLLGVLGTALT